MSADLRKLGKSSSIYVLGGILAKSAKFLLIPVYVRFLSPSEVGIVVWLEAIIFALGRLFSFGLGQAVKRFYVEYEDEREADAFAATIFWVGLLLAVSGGALLAMVAARWGSAFSEEIKASYLVLAIVAGVLQSNYSTPLQRFIVRQEPVKHGIFELIQFVFTAGMIIYLVVVADMGVAGVLWGQVIGGVVLNGVAAVVMTRPAGFQLRWDKMPEAFRYALPALPHLLFTWGITFADRPILERYVSLAALGIYGIGYQLASVMPVLTNSILNAWIARFFRTAGEEQGPREYARTLTYVFLALLSVSLGLVVLAPEIVAVLTTTTYAESATILRLIALGLVGHGTYQALLLVLFYVKKTQWVSVATGVAFVVNVGLNFALIPRWGIYAAAFSTIAAYLAATVVTYIASLRFYPVRLEYRRIGIIAGLFVLIGGLGWLVPVAWHLKGTALKIALLLVYPAVLLGLPGFLTAVERQALRRLRRRWVPSL